MALLAVAMAGAADPARRPVRSTAVSIVDGRWHLGGEPTYRDTQAEGLLMNVRMVNATFEDRNRPDFDADANARRFIAKIPDYVAHGARAFTLNLQGGMPGYEGAVNSAFEPDGTLRPEYMARVQRVIEACDRAGAVVILGCFYQRQDQVLRDDEAVRAGLLNVVRWIRNAGFTNVVLEVANEYGHKGYDHPALQTHERMAELVRLAKSAAPGLLVSTSEPGGRGAFPEGFHEKVAPACDLLLIHLNVTPLDRVPSRLDALQRDGKPVVCNEDEKLGEEGARVAELCVKRRVSWGLMHEKVNQRFPFAFDGASDDPVVYAKLKELTSVPRRSGAGLSSLESGVASAEPDEAYFPPPESQGGWRKLDSPDDIRRIAGMDPERLDALAQWLRDSDTRDFAAVVVRRGYVVLEVERNRSSVKATENIKSCGKAICATAAAIASERSRQGLTPRKMTFDDLAFDFIPWAQPLSDSRKAKITVRQLLNHTSGIAPESIGVKNRGPWEHVLGLDGDPKTARLAFDPGTDLDYTTYASYHAALMIETVTGKPYDQFAIEALLAPIGVEKWWFEFFDGGEKIGRHPSHTIGLPAREMARIAYCLLRGGRWGGRQVVPAWFIAETSEPTHAISGMKSFGRDAEGWSHGWELPGRLSGPRGAGIPRDARYRPGSGGQLIGWVPSLDIVIARQTGSSGAWEYEEYMRRACAAVIDRSN